MTSAQQQHTHTHTECEAWSKEMKNECSAWLDVNNLPVESMSPIIIYAFVFVYLNCFVLFCLQIWNYNVNGLEIEKIEIKKMEKETAVVSMPHAKSLCIDYWIRRIRRQKKNNNKIHYKVQHAHTTWVHNKRNKHNFQLIKIHLRITLKDNSTCFPTYIVKLNRALRLFVRQFTR